MNINSFGAFLTEKRLRKEVTLRKFAEMLKISPVQMCNLEKDRRNVNEKLLPKIAHLLLLSKDEVEEMHTLAAKSRNTVPKDLPEYINERDIVRLALRTAKDVDATDEEWQEFINRITKRSKNEKEVDQQAAKL